MRLLTVLTVAMLCACSSPPKPVTSANTDLYRVNYDEYDTYESLGYCDMQCKPDMVLCYERKNGKCQPVIKTNAHNRI